MRRLPSLVVLLLLFALATAANAQICVPELRSALSDLSAERPGTGIDAAVLLKRAVDLVEPGMPPFKAGATGPLSEDDPNADVVRFLAQRNLLPGGWSPDTLSREAWQAMIDRFLGWYDVERFEVHEPAGIGDLLFDVATALDGVSRAVRPAALIAADPDDPDRIAFLAIIWNWTSYPRLLVYRPREDLSLAEGPRAVLPKLGNCAVSVENYVTAPAATAAKLFLANNNSRMYVVGSVPARPGAWPMEVKAGEELDVFAFRSEALSGLSQYSAVFDGPEVGIGTVLGLLPRLRTNLSPTGFLSFMQTP